MVRGLAPVPGLLAPAPAEPRNTCFLFSNIPPFPVRERPAACSLHIRYGAAAATFKPLPTTSLSPPRVNHPEILLPRRRASARARALPERRLHAVLRHGTLIKGRGHPVNRNTVEGTTT